MYEEKLANRFVCLSSFKMGKLQEKLFVGFIKMEQIDPDVIPEEKKPLEPSNDEYYDED